jgi:hypothetical protein
MEVSSISPLTWKPLPLRAEEFHFSLVYAGANAGSERWMTQFDKGQFLIRREAIFHGGLGMSKRIQISRFEPNARLPVLFTENDSGRIFETAFDRRAGTVTLRQNRDEATQALTQDYHDPLSVVQLLRDLDPSIETLRVPMVGGTVLITRLDDELVETPWGEVMARAYYLRPGMGFIYIELEAPYRPLKFVQAMGRFVLESSLTRTNETRVTKIETKRPRGRAKQPQPQVQQKVSLPKPAPALAQRPENENAERKGKRKRRFRKHNKAQD